jgi:cytidylate kinase
MPAPAELPRVVAIDGPAGSGKSTVARLLAERIGAERLDTGAMYRAVAWLALQRGVDPTDGPSVAALTREAQIEVADRVLVDGTDVTQAIRTPEVDAAVSAVAAHPAVRAELVARQRRWVADRGAGVVEGRDIGTVVLPNAPLKLYLTASVEERARRRSAERGQGADAVAAVAAQLQERDRKDQSRAVSPLPRLEDAAADAFVVDTTELSAEAVVEAALAHWADRHPRAEAGPSAPPAPSGDVERGPASEASAAEARGLGRLGVSDRTYRFLRMLAHGINRICWRVEVDGADRVPHDGPVVLAPVHRSFVDFFVVSEVTPRKIYYMAKAELWRSARLGALVGSLGAFPVDRTGADRAALGAAEAVLERGDVLILFPEGTRRRGPIVEDLHEGATFLAARTGAVVVPIGIGGSDRVMPLGSRVPRPVKVRIVVGTPIHPPARTASGRVPRSQVRAMTEQLLAELQRVYDVACGRSAGG